MTLVRNLLVPVVLGRDGLQLSHGVLIWCGSHNPFNLVGVFCRGLHTQSYCLRSLKDLQSSQYTQKVAVLRISRPCLAAFQGRSKALGILSLVNYQITDEQEKPTFLQLPPA